MGFRRQFISVAFFLILVAQILNFGLSISSFESVYRKSVLSQYEILVMALKNNIETGLRNYKLYTNYSGIDRFFADLLERSRGELYEVLATDSTGKILYQSIQQADEVKFKKYDNQESIYLSDVVFDDFSKKPQTVQTHFIDGMYLISAPIISKDEWLGNAAIIFSERGILRKILSIIHADLKLLGLILVISAILLVAGTSLFLKPALFSDNSSSALKQVRLRFITVLVVTICASQALLSWFTLRSFQREYLRTILDKTDRVAILLKEDVEYLIRKGLPLHKLVGIEKVMTHIIIQTPEYTSLSIMDTSGNLLYLAEPAKQVVQAFRPGERTIMIPPRADRYAPLIPIIQSENRKEIGYIKVGIDKDLIDSRTRRVLLDYITIVVVALLLSFEAMLFFIARNFPAMAALSGQECQEPRASSSLIRNMGFLSMYASFLFMCFYSLYFKSLSRPLWGISSEVVGGLPISGFMFASSGGFILRGKLYERYGDRRSFFLGSLLFAVGLLLTGIATDITQVFGFQILAGLGFGIVYLTPQSLMVDQTLPEERPAAMASLFSGFYGGVICGSAMGGVLVERLGYRAVFILAAFMVIITYLFSDIYILRRTHKPSPSITTLTKGTISVAELLRDKKFMLPLIAQGIPYQIVYVGVLFFLLPLFLKSLQYSEGDIGRMITIHGLVIIASPVMIRFLSRWVNSEQQLLLAGALISAMLMGAYLLNSAPGERSSFYILIPWIITVAACNSILSSGVVSFSMSSATVEKFGSAKALGVYRLVERIGNITAPILCSTLLGVFAATQTEAVSYGSAIAVIGIIFLVGTVIFMAFGRK